MGDKNTNKGIENKKICTVVEMLEMSCYKLRVEGTMVNKSNVEMFYIFYDQILISLDYNK